jgi:hypothetical protein
MKSEKSDMLARTRIKRGMVLISISSYMRNYLMRSYDLGELSEAAKDALACEIVNLFEDRFLQLRKKSPPS